MPSKKSNWDSTPKRKTIAFVSNHPWSVYNFRIGAIRAVLSQGYKVTIITTYDKKYVDLFISEGCQFIPYDLDAGGKNILKDCKSFYQLWKIYRRLRPDFIFHYTIKSNIYGTVSARLLNIPSVAVICGMGYSFSQKNWLYFLVKLLYKFSLNWSREIWFINNFQKELFEDTHIVSSSKSRLLPGEGVNTSFFKPEKKDSSSGKFIFLMTGRMLWDKGVQEYVEAARNLKDKFPNRIECQLLGFTDVQNPNAISQKVIEAWHNEGIINFLGDTEDVRPYLKNADCLVLPTYYLEGVPRSLLEAASMQIPMITTNIAGCRDVVVDSQNGFLVEPKNKKDLFDKMQMMLQLDSSERAKMGKNGRTRVIELFDERLVIPFYLQVLEKYILNAHRVYHTE